VHGGLGEHAGAVEGDTLAAEHLHEACEVDGVGVAAAGDAGIGGAGEAVDGVGHADFVADALVEEGIPGLLPGKFGDGPGGFVSRNMLVLLFAAYAFAGLAVVHTLVANLQWRGTALGALYGAILVFGWPVAVIAVLGLVEPYANLKARARPGAPPSV
jgi:hypothetical protein